MRIKIGEVCVDSGLIYVGDPCYFWRDSRKGETLTSVERVAGADWVQFCETLEDVSHPQYKEYDQYGVVATSGCGDGIYPVYAQIEGKTIASITIDFLLHGDPDEENDDDKEEEDWEE